MGISTKFGIVCSAGLLLVLQPNAVAERKSTTTKSAPAPAPTPAPAPAPAPARLSKDALLAQAASLTKKLDGQQSALQTRADGAKRLAETTTEVQDSDKAWTSAKAALTANPADANAQAAEKAAAARYAAARQAQDAAKQASAAGETQVAVACVVLTTEFTKFKTDFPNIIASAVALTDGDKSDVSQAVAVLLGRIASATPPGDYCDVPPLAPPMKTKWEAELNAVAAAVKERYILKLISSHVTTADQALSELTQVSAIDGNIQRIATNLAGVGVTGITFLLPDAKMEGLLRKPEQSWEVSGGSITSFIGLGVAGISPLLNIIGTSQGGNGSGTMTGTGSSSSSNALNYTGLGLSAAGLVAALIGQVVEKSGKMPSSVQTAVDRVATNRVVELSLFALDDKISEVKSKYSEASLVLQNTPAGLQAIYTNDAQAEQTNAASLTGVIDPIVLADGDAKLTAAQRRQVTDAFSVWRPSAEQLRTDLTKVFAALSDDDAVVRRKLALLTDVISATDALVGKLRDYVGSQISRSTLCGTPASTDIDEFCKRKPSGSEHIGSSFMSVAGIDDLVRLGATNLHSAHDLAKAAAEATKAVDDVTNQIAALRTTMTQQFSDNLSAAASELDTLQTNKF